jgi:hypothetical protein
MFPQQPHGYRGRDLCEDEIMDRLTKQNVVVLTNQATEQCATGKSAIASSICSNERMRDHFSDGILWLTLSNAMVLHAKSYASFLEYVFEELHHQICPDLDGIIFNHCNKKKKTATSIRPFWENNIYALLSTMGPRPKYLLVLDNISDSSVLQSLETLGMTILVTIRSSALTLENNIPVSAVFENAENRSIFDNEEEQGGDVATRPTTFVSSLSSLLQSAYKLGYSDHSACGSNELCTRVPGSLVMKLLCAFSTLSKDLKEKFLLLSSLPADVFLPVSLVCCIWSSASVQGQTASMQSKEDDVIYLYHVSLIQLSADRETMMISSAAKKLMSVIFGQLASSVIGNDDLDRSTDVGGGLCALREDATEILEYLLVNDKDDFISFQFEKYSTALFGIFENIGWKASDVMEKYTLLFEKEIESSQFSSKNYSSQISILSCVEQVIQTLFQSMVIGRKQKINMSAQVDVDDESASDSFSYWCLKWLNKIVQCKEALYELYHDNDVPPVAFCDSLALLAQVSIECGHVQEAILSRKHIISIQREYLNEDDFELGKSLFYLACSQFISLEFVRSGERNDKDVHHDVSSTIQEVEKNCRLVVRCFQEYEQSSVVVAMADMSKALLVDILTLRGDRSAEVMEMLQEMLSSRKQFYSNVYHPQVADVYSKLAEVNHSIGNTEVAVKLMNKNIRIVRQIYGDFHLNTASALECLAEYFVIDQNFAKAETLLSKSIGIKQILCKQDSHNQESLLFSVHRLSTITAQRHTFEEAQGSLQSQTQPPAYVHEEPMSSPMEELKQSRGEKRAVGHTREDAILLIALADRIFKKEVNYAKAKKYVFKALKILSQCSRKGDNDVLIQGSDESSNNIVKWSAYNKLADICVCEDNIEEAAKFYHRALRGFLSINISDDPTLREQKAEAVVISFNLATLVDTSMEFQAAVPLYLKVVDIISQINTIIADFDNGNNGTIDPPFSSVDHAKMLISIADRFEANIRADNDEVASLVHDPVAMFHRQTKSHEATAPVNTPIFLLHVRTLALIVCVHHWGSDDETTIQCQDNLNRAAAIQPHTVDDADVITTDDVEFEGCNGEVKLDPVLDDYSTIVSGDNLTLLDDVELELHDEQQREAEERRRQRNEGLLTWRRDEEEDEVAAEDYKEEEEEEEDEDYKEEEEEEEEEEEDEDYKEEEEEEEEEEEVNESVYVFALGCCRRNQLHSNVLNGNNNCSYIGTTSSIEKYYMFVNKYDGKPFITTEPLPSDYAGVSKGVSCVIFGEIYCIPSSLLQSLHEDISNVHCVMQSRPIKLMNGTTKGGDTEVQQAHFQITDVREMSSSVIANCRNIPRGNYTEFIRARGGVEAFIENSKSSLK